MSKPQRGPNPPDYTRKLTRTITFKDGTTLTMRGDAATIIQKAGTLVRVLL
jgi:hypothetical protein